MELTLTGKEIELLDFSLTEGIAWFQQLQRKYDEYSKYADKEKYEQFSEYRHILENIQKRLGDTK